MDHARLVARLLQSEFSHLGYTDYAVPIISEEGDAKMWLERFQDSDRKTPVIATTAELLSTGVDVPSCRNIVFMKTISSPLLFKQIIGRGSRIDTITDKEWFRIIDYTDATRLFDEWDRPPEEPPVELEGPCTACIEGTVTDTESGRLIVGASVTILIGPNEQRGPILTDPDGCFCFRDLPAGTMRLSVVGPGFRRRRVTVETAADSIQTVIIELKSESVPVDKIKVKSLTVTIAEEATFLVESTGVQMTLSEYLNYTRDKVTNQTPNWATLMDVWMNQMTREAFLQALEADSIYIEVLGEIMAKADVDQFDLIAHIAFEKPIITRDERVDAFLNHEQQFMKDLNQQVREVILALLNKYRFAGIQEMTNPAVFRISPFREMGQAPGVIKRFGSVTALRDMLQEIQKRLYNAEVA